MLSITWMEPTSFLSPSISIFVICSFMLVAYKYPAVLFSLYLPPLLAVQQLLLPLLPLLLPPQPPLVLLLHPLPLLELLLPRLLLPLPPLLLPHLLLPLLLAHQALIISFPPPPPLLDLYRLLLPPPLLLPPIPPLVLLLPLLPLSLLALLLPLPLHLPVSHLHFLLPDLPLIQLPYWKCSGQFQNIKKIIILIHLFAALPFPSSTMTILLLIPLLILEVKSSFSPYPPNRGISFLALRSLSFHPMGK